MIAEKSNRLQQKGFHSKGGNRRECLFDSGADPRSTAGALALKCKPPLRNLRHASSHELSRVPGFLRVGIDARARPKSWLGWLALAVRRRLHRAHRHTVS